MQLGFGARDTQLELAVVSRGLRCISSPISPSMHHASAHEHQAPASSGHPPTLRPGLPALHRSSPQVGPILPPASLAPTHSQSPSPRPGQRPTLKCPPTLPPPPAGDASPACSLPLEKRPLLQGPAPTTAPTTPVTPPTPPREWRFWPVQQGGLLRPRTPGGGSL